MRDVHLLYLELDNTQCVMEALDGNLEDALERFGPDQLGVARITQVFDTDPVLLNMQWIRLNTYDAYRQKYPGRALLACDGLQATKYPPDPISWCFFTGFYFLRQLTPLEKTLMVPSLITSKTSTIMKATFTSNRLSTQKVRNTLALCFTLVLTLVYPFQRSRLMSIVKG